jgi:hypothetical protein
MVSQSRLHVPRTPARPGEAPDFAYLKLPRPADRAGRIRLQRSAIPSEELVRVTMTAPCSRSGTAPRCG